MKTVHEQVADEETRLAAIDTAEAKEERDAMFAALASNLNTELGKAIADKTPIETRMLADESQYWGSPEGTWDKEDVAAGYSQRPRSRGAATDNKTRSKTRIAAARISDMLFPTNVPNWGMSPTPYPEVDMDLIMEEYQREQALKAPPPEQAPPGQGMMGGIPPEGMPPEGMPPEGMPPEGMPPEGMPPEGMMEDMGEGMAPEGMAEDMKEGMAPEPNYELLALKVAAKRCRKMAQRIKDVLVENKYAKAGREVISDGCKLGTGIIKGPYVRFQIKRSYEPVKDGDGEATAMKVERVKIPGVARVSPWMFYPLRARRIDECEGSFELHILTATQIQKMVKTHGFYPGQTNILLRTRPGLGEIESVMNKRAAITNYSMSRYDQSYAVWEYQGVIDGKVLRQMGFEVEEDDELTSFYGAVWFAGNSILRIDMSPLEADSALPYHVWNYEEDETNIFGFGVPFVMRDDQYVIDMVWSAILHNTSISAGPQIAVEKGVLTPADNSYHIRGPKLWYKNDVDVPMAQAFDVAVIPSTVQSTMPVYQQALQNADANTNLPLMLGDGGASGSQQGLSGQAQITVMNQTNIVQRQSAHAWDDNITEPLIGRLYDWFMQGDEEDIKGDYQVQVLGASHLLVKDTHAQHAQMLLQMSQNDPELKMILNIEELYRIYLMFLDISTDTVVKTPEEVKEAQDTQQPDPVQQADIAKTNAEADLATAKAENERMQMQLDQQRLQMEQQGAGGEGPEQVTQKDIMEIQLEYAKLQAKEADQNTQIMVEQLRQQTSLLKLASDEKISYQKVMADMEGMQMKLGMEARIKGQQKQSDDYFRAAEIKLKEYSEKLKAANLAKGFDTF